MTDKERDDVIADILNRVSGLEKEVKEIKDSLNIIKQKTDKPSVSGTIDGGSYWDKT